MENIRKIHRQAMNFSKMAKYALEEDNDKELCNTYWTCAFFLEKHAALLLQSEKGNELMKSVYFRSAAHLANNVGFFKEAMELIEIGLSGNPPSEIKVELEDLKTKVEATIKNN
jgi:hypothetical protein